MPPKVIGNSTHVRWLYASLNDSFRGSKDLFLVLWTLAHVCTNPHRDTVKERKFESEVTNMFLFVFCKNSSAKLYTWINTHQSWFYYCWTHFFCGCLINKTEVIPRVPGTWKQLIILELQNEYSYLNGYFPMYRFIFSLRLLLI